MKHRLTSSLCLALFAGWGLLSSCLAEITRQDLSRAQEQIQQLVQLAIPATVSLIPGNEGQGRFGTGSGVLVTRDGLILTAAHVAVEMNDRVTVIFPNGDRASAKVLGMDFSRDAAMVQIEEAGDYPFVELGDSSDLEKNDWCIALGHASGFQADRTPPVRLGRVIRNDEESFLMSDCTLIGGDSGGPLFDLEGRLVGIHSNIGYSLSQNNHVPISTFLDNWARLVSGERFGGAHLGGFLDNPQRPMLGVVLEDSPAGGAQIRDVMPGSPAEKAGLKPGSVITRIEKVDIADTRQLIEEVGRYKVGQTLSLRIKKDDGELDVGVKLTAAAKIPNLPQSREQQLRLPRGEERRPLTNRERRELQVEFNKMMRRFLEEGDIQINRDLVEKYGGPDELAGFMMRFGRTLSEEEQAKLVELVDGVAVEPGVFDPDKPVFVGEGFFREVLNAFRPSVATASDATHLVFRGNEWKSLCTVVHEDGYAVTKASEIETKNNQALTVMLAKGNQAPARIVKTFPRYDLALIRIENAPKLPAVRFQARELPLGALLAAAGSGPDPVAIGVVSVPPRKMSSHNKGFLGIATAFAPNGVRVAQVLSGGNAGRAGIRAGDIITMVDEESCDTPEKLIRVISGTDPGAEVKIEFLRDGEKKSLMVQLGNRGDIDVDMVDRNGQMNRMGTELSKRRSGYPKAVQTDLPVKPQECGGPVVNFEGEIVGITIARAGRIKTYALPSAVVSDLLADELARLKSSEQPAPF